MCLNLEHYNASSHSDGRFVPRKRATTRIEATATGGIRTIVEPYEAWNVETEIALERREKWVFEATYSFSFNEEIRDFLPFFSNYFVEPTEPFMRFGDAWFQPRLSEREHRFWARSAEHAEVTRRVHHENETPEIVAIKPVVVA